MNRKQGIIIVVLLALIATAGVLASRLNTPLNVAENKDAQNPVVSFDGDNGNIKDDDSNLKAEYFAAAKTERSQKFSETIQTLKVVMEDKNISEETRKDAESKYLDITMNNNYESKVELSLKARGYQDVVCVIDNDRVNVIIKSDEPLDEKTAREIKTEIVRITNLVDVTMEVHK